MCGEEGRRRAFFSHVGDLSPFFPLPFPTFPGKDQNEREEEVKELAHAAFPLLLSGQRGTLLFFPFLFFSSPFTPTCARPGAKEIRIGTAAVTLRDQMTPPPSFFSLSPFPLTF